MLKTRAGDIIGDGRTPGLKRFLRIRSVTEATGLPPSTIYQKMADGTFPHSIRLSERISAWDADEIAEWQQARIAERAVA